MALGNPIKRKLRSRAIPFCALLSLIVTSGCTSITYVDSHKTRHVIGFVDIATQDSTSKQPTTNAITLTTFGLAVYRRPGSNSGITLGYNRETFISLPNNACLDLNNSAMCDAALPKPDTKGATEP